MKGWFKAYYDKLLATAVLLLLLGSLVILGLQAGRERSAQIGFDGELQRLRPRYPQATPVSRAPFLETKGRYEKPFQLAWVRKFMVPELRVACVACGRPIPFDATKCVYSICGAAQPEDPTVSTDRDGDGMPNEWEEKFGLNPLDPADAMLDRDNDGFTNLEECRFKTDPSNANAFPPPVAKLHVESIVPIPFSLVFKGVNTVGTNRVFQVNLRTGGRTFWAEMGQEIEGFRVVGYEDRGVKESVLTLQRDEKKFRLIKDRMVPWNEYEIVLSFDIDGSTHRVRIGSQLELKGARYEVKEVDTVNKRVLIRDLTRNEDSWVAGRLLESKAAESVPEP